MAQQATMQIGNMPLVVAFSPIGTFSIHRRTEFPGLIDQEGGVNLAVFDTYGYTIRDTRAGYGEALDPEEHTEVVAWVNKQR